ncbi:RloB family protein [Bifidobacterium cuniculi]|uniref:R-lob like protein n=1 Tax=Bifidobacterium cuniculi TaxID=1688 RepID=A0A087AWP1_9BIFI|nr:RloB family protein [Bifidobacterium cuniculi]KFI63191.1 R-lob like protein [Bifidobacterium cuniculi]
MGRRRELPHGRCVRRSARQRKHRYLVVAGGEVTERQYFKQLESVYGIVIDYRSYNESPSKLARQAVRIRDEDRRDTDVDPYECVWVVVDVDQFTDLRDAQQYCRSHGIELIISNPCFEVWLIDHVRVCPPSLTQAKAAEAEAVRLQVSGGARGKYVHLEDVGDLLDVAVRNAEKHNDDGKRVGRDQLNGPAYAPWTDMPAVIRYLDGREKRA